MRTNRPGHRDFVGALASGLKVIEAFDRENPKLTLSEVARRTGLTRAAARRHLLTLAELGYAGFDGRLFSLAPRVLRLGHAYLSTIPLPGLAEPMLEAVGEATGEVASIAVLEGADVVFLARSQARRIVSATVGIGTRLPAYCTSTGRVLLAGRETRELKAFLRELKPVRHTAKTKVRIEDLRAAIDEARLQGYAISDEEYEIGLRTISVPVANSAGRIVAAMSASVQSARMMPAEMIAVLLPALTAASRDLSALL